MEKTGERRKLKTRKANKSHFSVISESFKILTKEDKRKLGIVTVLQVLMGFLDLIGVAAVGLVAALSINGVQSRPPGTRVSQLLDVLGIGEVKFQSQVAILAGMAAIILITRTLASMYFTRKIFYYLSRRAAVISSKLVSKLLAQDLLSIQSRSSQETLFAVTSGVGMLMLNVIGTVINLASDLFLLLILSGGLLAIDPLIALMTFVLFASVGLILYFSVQNRVNVLGNESARLTIKSNEKILEVLNSYRELFVRNRRSFYSKEIGQTRLQLANTSAELAFIPNISKYVIEITLVFGAVAMCAIQFMLKDASHAIATLSVFLAAGSRIAPAILRIQTGAIAVKSSAGPVGITLDLYNNFAEEAIDDQRDVALEVVHQGFKPNLRISNVNFKYPGASTPTIIDACLEVREGEVIAFVGPSGAGKTTLVDLALGILTPDSGDIEISGISPTGAIAHWPGAIAYVPQDVQIIDASILSNIAMGFPESEQRSELAFEALRISQLDEFLEVKNQDLSSRVGERGSKLSGGQRQRLGIARALYSRPKLLVLDEATSSLDGQTESDISEAIFSLRGNVTVLLIAHRLSTVRNADRVIYMEAGKILADGTFEEVRGKIPNFDSQAALMGL
jgi:ABC-type multidrug transport system fused ATPase/permease subunit